MKQLYRNTNYPIVLFTDGNQTIGNDYAFSFQENISVLPVVLGDTTTVLDLKINQINVNKYAFLKNKFPCCQMLHPSEQSLTILMSPQMQAGIRAVRAPFA